MSIGFSTYRDERGYSAELIVAYFAEFKGMIELNKIKNLISVQSLSITHMLSLAYSPKDTCYVQCPFRSCRSLTFLIQWVVALATCNFINKRQKMHLHAKKKRNNDFEYKKSKVVFTVIKKMEELC